MGVIVGQLEGIKGRQQRPGEAERHPAGASPARALPLGGGKIRCITRGRRVFEGMMI